MTERELQYFRVIGKIHDCISKAESFDAAVTSCLRIVIENSMADYAVVWRTDSPETTVLHPMYWICPGDLSSRSYRPGEGIVGRTFLTRRPETVFDCKRDAERTLLEDFPGLALGSVTCLPLNSGDYCHGCVQFIKSAENGFFTQEEVDTCELLTMMAQLEIKAEAPPENYVQKKNILLSVENVHKYFQSGETENHVLKGVNLGIYEGEFLCLLGESGCGKSTMLNIIGGLLNFEEGSVTFSGRNIAGFSKKELTDYRRKNIGFVFQSYNLMPNLNALQNVDLVGELVDDPADSMELLELVGLADKADRYPAQLSGGQQQRTAIARAMVKKPKLILADEPTAALDYATSVEVLSVMENVVKSGTTLLIVTHNEEITKMADRVIRFRDGKVFEVRVNARPCHAADLIW